MVKFDLPPGAYRYRPLREAEPPQQGWDVYALQTALNGLARLGVELELDGVFGTETAKGVRKFQRKNKLVADGIAGVVTQRALALKYARRFKKDLPGGLLKGQIEHESSFWLGNHSPAREDGSRDNGVCQRNSNYTPAMLAYDVPNSVQALAHQVSAKHADYVAQGNVGERRAWELAAGSWNAPAWTDTLARGGTISPSQLEHIETYIQDVTPYMRIK